MQTRERAWQLSQGDHAANGRFKVAEDFRVLDAPSDSAVWLATADIVDQILLGAPITDLYSASSRLASVAALPDNDEAANLLLAWACAAALARSPSVETWVFVKSIAYQSWEVEHWIDPAMMMAAESVIGARDAFCGLAKDVFEQLDAGKVISERSRFAAERERHWNHWNSHGDQLIDLWWGLRWDNSMSYEDEFALFSVWSRLSLADFARSLGEAVNPSLVQSALVVTGAGPFNPSFDTWTLLVELSPPTFDVDGRWNGSILAPLLLVSARREIHQTASAVLRQNVDADDDVLSEEIMQAAGAVATVLAKRADRLGLFVRWSTWLTRQMLGSPVTDLVSPRTSFFVDKSLMDAMGERLRGDSFPVESPLDASAWEPWCYYCSQSYLANSGYIVPPSPRPFLEEWVVSPDDWAGARGRSLHDRASLFITLTKEIPGFSGHLLAFPMIEQRKAEEYWYETWVATHTLREIVEFGDFDAGSDEYSRRVEASHLLLLLFRIGMAVLDQGSSGRPVAGSSETLALVAHHAVMADAAREMVAIDDTINRSLWETMALHLATRRFIWEQRDDDAPEPGAIFTPGDHPTPAGYLALAKGNPSALVELLFSVAQNKPGVEQLRRSVSDAAIDIDGAALALNRLRALSPRHYPFDESRLRQVRNLLHD
jgi:hypothetical protein